jgi:hypothetical protein
VPRLTGYRGRVWILVLALLAACGDDPVLSAVAPPPAPEDPPASPAPSAPGTVAEVRARRQAQVRRASPEAMDGAYVRPKGVFVDVPYFAGRDLEAAREEAVRQLGGEPTRDAPTDDGARRLVFPRGSLRVVGGRIQMVEVTLPEPVRRSEALGVLNIPAVAETYRPYRLEFRLANVHGLRRIQLTRASPGSEDIVRVAAWKFLNRDR